MTPPPERTGGEILADQLLAQSAGHVFCVPGESFLALLDALRDRPLTLTVCRQEGGAAMMAEAHGKLTGRPGIAVVTRGPGATNASAGVHVARQDSTPMILFIGQVARAHRGREAFQEVDYRQMFGGEMGLAKWAVEVDSAARLPEIVSRAFHIAMSGRPGPVVVALPEDVLTECARVPDAGRAEPPDPDPAPEPLAEALATLAGAERPVVVAGGSRWTEAATADLGAFAERFALPVAVTFRRQALFSSRHPHFAGDLGIGADAALARAVREADAVLLLGTRLSEIASQGYTLLDSPEPGPRVIHVHPDPDELGRVYRPAPGLACAPPAFLRAALAAAAPAPRDRTRHIAALHAAAEARRRPPARVPGAFDPAAAIAHLGAALPPEAILCNGAGNYATWLHRFHRYERFGSQLAPTSGSMGYGLPAAIAAARTGRGPAVALAGDGCFLMTGQEFATAVQYRLPLLVIVFDNGMYGTIRMHQERSYPGRVSGTGLVNPDFAAMARAFGGFGARVERTADFAPALAQALAQAGEAGVPALLHCLLDPEALTVDRTLSEIRGARPSP